MMLRLRYLFLALAACLALSGCGSKKNYKYRIAVIPKGPYVLPYIGGTA